MAPARKIGREEVEYAVAKIEKQGFTPYFEEDLFAVDRQFAGTDLQRTDYFQRMLDRKDIRAVISARGGYGSVRVIDGLDLSRFRNDPKWVVGYSDMTVFHSHIVKHTGIQTLHASMPLNFAENTEEALQGLFDVLKGKTPEYHISSHILNRKGDASGTLVGGNLSVLYSLLGSRSFPETKGAILFLEDLDEYLYHIDRMMVGLKRAGVLQGVAALVVGGMTEMNDNEVPFGRTPEEIIMEAVAEYQFPVCFDFPAGHIPDNRPLIMGAPAELKVGSRISLKFI